MSAALPPFGSGMKGKDGAPAVYPAPAIESSLGVGWIFTEMCPLERAGFWQLFALVLKRGPSSHWDQQLLLKVEELVDFKTVAGTRHHFLQRCPDLRLAGPLPPGPLKVVIDLLKHLRSQLLHGGPATEQERQELPREITCRKCTSND